MANDGPKGGQAGRPGRNRRQPPTIDLQATEVAAPEPTEPVPVDEPPPNTAPRPVVEPPPPEPIVPPEREPPFDDTDPPDGGPPPPPAGGGFRPVLGGAIAGGVIAAIVLLIAWGVFGRTDRDTALHQQAVRIGDVETALRDLATRKPPASVGPAAVDALAQRLAKVEATATSAPTGSAAATDPALATRLATLEKTIGGLKDEITAIDQRNSKTATAVDAVRQRAENAAATAATAQSSSEQGDATVHKDVDALNNRLAALERTAQTMQTNVAALAKARGAPGSERVVRLAIAAEALKLAVARSEHFRAELDAAKTLAANPATLAPLETFAGSGVPTSASLGRELGGLLPAMRRLVAPPQNEDSGFLQRLQVNAERLVRIHPVGESAGDDAGSVLARLEVRAEHGNIGGALAELDKLPAAVRAPAESWIKKARGRDAALDASERFAATALGALAQPAE